MSYYNDISREYARQHEKQMRKNEKLKAKTERREAERKIHVAVALRTIVAQQAALSFIVINGEQMMPIVALTALADELAPPPPPEPVKPTDPINAFPGEVWCRSHPNLDGPEIELLALCMKTQADGSGNLWTILSPTPWAVDGLMNDSEIRSCGVTEKFTGDLAATIRAIELSQIGE